VVLITYRQKSVNGEESSLTAHVNGALDMKAYDGGVTSSEATAFHLFQVKFESKWF
jgi:hypothetical protein